MKENFFLKILDIINQYLKNILKDDNLELITKTIYQKFSFYRYKTLLY